MTNEMTIPACAPLFCLVAVLLTSCATPDPKPNTDTDAYIFAQPYPETARSTNNSDTDSDHASSLSSSSCEEGRTKVRKGIKFIENAQRTFSDALENRSEYNNSYMLLLRGEQDQLKKAGELRKKGMKQLINGLFVLYHPDEDRSDLPFDTLDQRLREDIELTDSIQDKRMGPFSDFEGIYSGLKEETTLLNEIKNVAQQFLRKHECGE